MPFILFVAMVMVDRDITRVEIHVRPKAGSPNPGRIAPERFPVSTRTNCGDRAE
jgi:hypothetical protein